MITVKDLQDFEEEVASIYEKGQIRGPIHLRDGNESQLIHLFANITQNDYVFCTWANHLHALLKGIPRHEVMQRILDGNSMAMNFPQYKFYTSAIVGGTCPIALGVAESIKRQKRKDWVYVFLGDMAFRCGIAQESIQYSIYENLPVYWIIEDNDKSVSTPTSDFYRSTVRVIDNLNKLARIHKSKNPFGYCSKIQRYTFTSKWPHSGIGKFLSF